jgi:hypothetical protein
MARKSHHPPISGGDQALTKEITKSRAMTHIFARSAEKRREGEALIREADSYACQSLNERLAARQGNHLLADMLEERHPPRHI